MKYIKPSNPTIIVNGDVYVKDPDKDFLFVSIYRNRYKQRMLKVEHNRVFGEWMLHLVSGFKFVKDLSIIQLNEEEIETYLTESQHEALGNLITQTLLSI